MFTDGSRLDNGATGYSVVWRRGLTWTGAKVHMGNNQEAYDAECAALAHALELAAQRSATPERVTIFSDAQAAIRRMASDEPGPGQQYALQARKHIATLRRARKGIVIEIRWCPAHKGVAGNEKADEWAKVAAGEPNTRGVEWLSSSGRMKARVAPLPRSLASLKRDVTLGYRAHRVSIRGDLGRGDQRRRERNAEGLYSGPSRLEANFGLRESRREIRNGIKSYGRKDTDLGP